MGRPTILASTLRAHRADLARLDTPARLRAIAGLLTAAAEESDDPLLQAIMVDLAACAAVDAADALRASVTVNADGGAS